uniref:Hedgehog n=1 Tax=Acrobeloides nanus TaxID=290746 RepID=A0A914CZQ9_9BILA
MTFLMQTFPRSFTTRQEGYEFNIQILDCSYVYGLLCPVGTVDANEPNLPLNEKLCCKNTHSNYTLENVAILNTNEEIAGGAVMFKGRIIGYDYISSVYKLSTNGRGIYQVQTRRLNCLTHETHNSTKVSKNQAHAVQTYYPVNGYNGEAAPAYYPANERTRCKRQFDGTCPSDLFCFSDDMEIDTWDGTKKMVDLKIGDVVKAYSIYNKYDPILSFLHRLPEQEAEFIQFNLTNDKILKITPNHLIYKVDCNQEYSNEDINNLKAVPSQTINLNDCLLSWSESISTIKQKGIFAPLTTGGTILVNGIYASCYSVSENYSLLKGTSQIMQKLNGLLDYLLWSTEENSIKKSEIDIPFSTQILLLACCVW